jgi:competence protein ComEA
MHRVFFVMAFVMALAAIAQPTAAGQTKERAAKPKAAAVSAAPLNLNTATAAELQALPGVGASTAKLIVEHRSRNGGFKKVEELMNIKGIGEKSFLKLKPLVTVAPEKGEAAEKKSSQTGA